MKGLNIALTVVILLLAIVSAVFSFFLFEKREQLTKGWSMMVGEINRTAKVLDAGSGSSSSSQLNDQTLAHIKYADLSTNLKNLSEQANKVIKERDAMAGALREMANLVEMSRENIPTDEQLKGLTTYDNSVQQIMLAATSFRARYEEMVRSTTDNAKLLGLNVSAADVKGNAAGVNKDMINTIKNNLSAIRTYQTGMREIVRQLTDEVRNIAPKINPDDVSETIASILGGIDATRGELAKAADTVAAMTRKMNELQNAMVASDGRIAELTKSMDNQLKEIETLRRIINKGKGGVIPAPWIDGSPESRLNARGVVLRSNDKYGVIAVDLGTETRVKQDILGMINPTDPQIPAGAILNVVRGDGPDAKLIGQIRIVDVGKNSSTAEFISGSSADGVSPKEGDAVYFSKDEVARLSALKNAE